ncbi:hypothetical protein ASPACDRAFT_40724 [Aspergillus aculeatus ATCC 16872]|uniref:2EXR domain-containing protein n=1 Tax=Aspergillus aculeatus (strain ATCC 16872 / CBS 172.66 / WB 5094) TaxID=690307 RepID=A0A1L9X1A1_ASPA1|nr:uncharacterized protein ASPACDRAFT_40724 [Aspergillus aculeatus ATCC 16872]OJK01908.1 hypothetical protein ASPACDRAFT_40724 [Aspergillus aculeatus ATCC 16872]
MPAPKNKHPTFRRFPWLPTELRLEIWKHALPILTDKATLYPWVEKTDWKRGRKSRYCWIKPTLYYPVAPRTHQIAMPLLYVNHESHSVALDWLNKHRPLRKRFNHKGTFLLTRPFFAEDDTLYLGLDHAAPDYKDSLLPRPEFKQLAVSEEFFLADPSGLCYLVRCLYRCRSYSIVVGNGPAPYSSDLPKKEKMVERWEIDGPRETILKWEASQGEALLWNPNGIVSAALHTLLILTYPHLSRVVAESWYPRTFTIDAVRAVRR